MVLSEALPLLPQTTILVRPVVEGSNGGMPIRMVCEELPPSTLVVHSLLPEDDIENLVAFAHNLAAGLDAADKDFAKRQQIVEILNVRGILMVENGQQVCTASFILTGENTKRLVLPKRGENVSVTTAAL